MTKIREEYGGNQSLGRESAASYGRMPSWSEILEGIIEENKKFIDRKYQDKSSENLRVGQVEQEKKNMEIAWRAFIFAADLGDLH